MRGAFCACRTGPIVRRRPSATQRGTPGGRKVPAAARSSSASTLRADVAPRCASSHGVVRAKTLTRRRLCAGLFVSLPAPHSHRRRRADPADWAGLLWAGAARGGPERHGWRGLLLPHPLRALHRAHHRDGLGQGGGAHFCGPCGPGRCVADHVLTRCRAGRPPSRVRPVWPPQERAPHPPQRLRLRALPPSTVH